MLQHKWDCGHLQLSTRDRVIKLSIIFLKCLYLLVLFVTEATAAWKLQGHEDEQHDHGGNDLARLSYSDM